MFDRIFIEEDIFDHAQTNNILERFSTVPYTLVPRYDSIFGKVKKPYLQKRENLNLFLAKKRGPLVKLAPDAYGTKGDPHYYFIHAYNCIYECEYCYLQGYFSSPDLVLFVNHEEIIGEMEKIIHSLGNSQKAWFHAGEFSDSLALSHITGEVPLYFDFFKKFPGAYLELRTKSANIKELLKVDPLPNVITSFSLSPEMATKKHDLKTPNLKARLLAIKKLHEAGHPIGIHFDPIIHSENFEEDYRQLLLDLNEVIPLSQIQYLSLGVVRFTKDVYHQVKKNYPESPLLAQEFIKSFDNKIRYPRPMRLSMMNTVQSLAQEQGMESEKIYLCMEE